MINEDKDLIDYMKNCYNYRLNREEYKCREDLLPVIHSHQISYPKEDVSAEVYREYFKYTSKLAEKFPRWSVIGYCMNTQGYTVDASGSVRNNYGRKVEDHPLIKAAKLAPDEFREFVVTSLAAAADHSEYIMAMLFENQKAFGLKNGDLSDILHQALEKREQNWKHDGNKDILARNIFYTIISENNNDLRKDFMTKYPQDFEKVLKASVKGINGYNALMAMGDGERNPVKPGIQEWIDKNPEIYGEIVQTAVSEHCVRYNGLRQKKEFDAIMTRVNKCFLAKNPDFIAQCEQKKQQSIILNSQRVLGSNRYR